MKLWRHSLWLVLALGPSIADGAPFTCNDPANTCTYRITVIEPTKKTSGANLDNYKQTNVKRRVNAGAFVTDILLATNPAGGGTVWEDITFPTVPCVVTTFSVKVSGTNTANLEGADSALASVTRNRLNEAICIPDIPTGVGVD